MIPMDKVLTWKAHLTEPHMREMLLGSAAGLTIKVLAALSLFAMNVVVTRTVGASEAGLFFLGFTLVTIVATVGRVGLDQAVVKFVATEYACGAFGKVHSVYRKALSWAVFATAIVALTLWLNAAWVTDSIFSIEGFEPVLNVMVIAAPFIAVYIIHAQALQGLKRISKSMLVSSVCLPAGILAAILVFPVTTAYDLSKYFVIASMITVVIGRFFWKQSVSNASLTPSSVSHDAAFISSSLLRKSCMPLWTVAIVHQVIQWSSQLMLGVWEDAQSIAFFATAQRTAMLTSFILFAVNSIAAPKFAVMYNSGDHDGLKRLALLSVKMMMLVAVPTTLFILIFPEWLMSMFGDEFVEASTALMILASGQFVNIATGSVGYLLSMTGNEVKVRDNMLISGALTIILGVALIPAFGVIGAAIAYACGVSSQNLLCVYQVNKQLGFNTLLFWKA